MSGLSGLRSLWEDFNDFLEVDVEVSNDDSVNQELPVITKFTVTNNGQAQDDRPEIVFEEVILNISVLPDSWEERVENLAAGESFSYEHRCNYTDIMRMQWDIRGKVSPESILQFRRRPDSIKRTKQFSVKAYFDFLEQMNIHQWLNGILKPLTSPGPDTTLAEMKEKEKSLSDTSGELRNSAKQLQDFLGLVNYDKYREDLLKHKKALDEYLQFTERNIAELIKVLRENKIDHFDKTRDKIVNELAVRADSIDVLTHELAIKLGLIEPDVDDKNDDKVSHIEYPSPITIREVDLHGYTVEEAIPFVEQFLKESYGDNVRRVRIIHGKGIFVLQKAIREYLGIHKLVETESISAADKDHGGEGATEANLIGFSIENLGWNKRIIRSENG